MSDAPVLLYDGSCGFCSRIVLFVLRRDPEGALRFAPLQGSFGQKVIEAYPELNRLDSVIWFQPRETEDGPRVLVESDAALELAFYLGGLWSLAGLFRWVPKMVRDAAYRWVALHRHSILAPDKCLVPGEMEGSRFLKDDGRLTDL